MSGCDNITDEGIRAVATGLPQLQSLDISGCDKITDAGIRALANGLSQLQSLNI
jgi:F-box/leucine-rich repeat protein 2/20